jgi:putative endonuclease
MGDRLTVGRMPLEHLILVRIQIPQPPVMYYIYILESEKDNKHYIGFTSNLEERLAKHNKGYVQSTKYRRPLKLVYYEQFENRNKAYKREKEIKNMKNGVQFKALVKSSNGHREAGSRSAG